MGTYLPVGKDKPIHAAVVYFINFGNQYLDYTVNVKIIDQITNLTGPDWETPGSEKI